MGWWVFEVTESGYKRGSDAHECENKGDDLTQKQ